jgi:DNA-binding NtrC family response regulator
MKRAVIVSHEPARFSPLEKMLERQGLGVEYASSGKLLLERLDSLSPEKPVALIILSSGLEDMGPKPLVEAVTEKSPFSHCVVAGSMTDKDFHDFYEGYGVLMQVSETPDAEDVEKLSAHLDKLTRLGTF